MGEHSGTLRSSDYYANVLPTLNHIPPRNFPLTIIEEGRRPGYLRRLDTRSAASVSAGIVSVIRSIANTNMPFGGALKIGEVPVAMSNATDIDSARVVRGTHTAQNTLVLSYRPEHGPFTVVQGGFPVISEIYPNVEVVRYQLALVTQSRLDGPRVYSIGTRYGTQHQHVQDNFGNWVRLDLDPNQVESAGLPHGNIREFKICNDMPDWIPYLLTQSLTQHFNSRNTALSAPFFNADQE